MIIRFKLISLLFLLFSCDKDKNIRTYSLPKVQTISSASFQELEDEKSFSWQVPQSWIEKDPSSMRLASFDVPYGNNIADISITNFSGDGGGLLANVNRWRRQLELDPISIERINSLISFGKSELGKFKYIKIINDQDLSSAFMCAILEVKNSTVFVKLNAPVDGIKQLEKEFLLFCSSFK